MLLLLQLRVHARVVLLLLRQREERRHARRGRRAAGSTADCRRRTTERSEVAHGRAARVDLLRVLHLMRVSVTERSARRVVVVDDVENLLRVTERRERVRGRQTMLLRLLRRLQVQRAGGRVHGGARPADSIRDARVRVRWRQGGQVLLQLRVRRRGCREGAMTRHARGGVVRSRGGGVGRVRVRLHVRTSQRIVAAEAVGAVVREPIGRWIQRVDIEASASRRSRCRGPCSGAASPRERGGRRRQRGRRVQRRSKGRDGRGVRVRLLHAP